MNVLVVEDERNLADAIVRIVSDAGFNCEAVYDGNTGLTAAESGLYDAVIMDVMLPGLDGIQITKELRHKGNSIPILMLTARTSTTDKVEGLRRRRRRLHDQAVRGTRAAREASRPHAQAGRRS